MQSVSQFNEVTRQRIAELSQYFLTHGISDAATAQHQAVIAIGRSVRKQATIMAYSDVFILLGIALVGALMITLVLKKSEGGAAGGAH